MSIERPTISEADRKKLEAEIARFVKNFADIIIGMWASQLPDKEGTVAEGETDKEPLAEDKAGEASVEDGPLIYKDMPYLAAMRRLRAALPAYLSELELQAVSLDHTLKQFDELFQRLEVSFTIISLKTEAEVKRYIRAKVDSTELNSYPFVFYLFNAGGGEAPDNIHLWIYATETQQVLCKINVDEENIRTPRDAAVTLLLGMEEADAQASIREEEEIRKADQTAQDAINPLYKELRDIIGPPTDEKK